MTAATAPVLRRLEGHFEAAGGRELFERAWLPQVPRAAALLVHGLAEHSGRYEHVGTWLAQRGIAVRAYDQQGHGRSPGTRYYARRFSDLLDDAASALERTRRAHPDLPIFLIGHSMGALVVGALASEREPDVAGVITSGAALITPTRPPRLQLALLRVARRILPRLAIPNGLDPAGLSADPEVARAYLDDPLVGSRITLSLASELFAQMRRTATRGQAVSRPLLALHGEGDPICAASGSEAFAASAPHGRYLGFPGLRHEIFNEPQRAVVFERMLAWLDEVCGKR